MATYETGSATGPEDLITKLATFAQSLGWSVSGTSVTTSTPQAPDNTVPGEATNVTGRVFSKGTLYFGVGYDTDDVWLCGATGASGGDWASQTGSSCTSTSGYMPRANQMPGPYIAYHFFGGTAPDYLHVVVERAAGVFNHFVMGELNKAGSYTGGAYVDAVTWFNAIWSYNNQTPVYVRRAPEFGGHSLLFDANFSTYNTQHAGVVRADIDGKTNNWMPFRSDLGGGNRARGDVRYNGFSFHNVIRAPNNFNQLTPLQPIVVIGDRPASLLSILGFAPDIRAINMENFAPGQLLTIGSDEWLIFPAIQKTAVNDGGNSSESADYSSGRYGYAYKRN